MCGCEWVDVGVGMVVVGGWGCLPLFFCYPFNTSISSLQFSSKGLVSREISKCKAGAEGNLTIFPALNNGLLFRPQFKIWAGHLVVRLTLEPSYVFCHQSLVSTMSYCRANLFQCLSANKHFDIRFVDQQTYMISACPQTNILILSENI